ncbi:hypothetical protein ACL07V_37025 [Streptomyces sp. MB22_4]|uniref:hypothetical protein n=1 Tax=Streptomyces sp. MB22_4 TaxID=3383120 RepID=UPI0039A286CF
MSHVRVYLPALVSTVLYIGFGIGLGLLWWAVTGRTDMPWWLVILLVVAAGWISDLAEQTLRHWRLWRQHTATHARPRTVRKAA